MKKKITLIVAAVLIISLLCSCGASADSKGCAEAELYYDEYEKFDGYETTAAEAPAENGISVAQTITKNSDLNEKIIYSASSTVETVDFDNAVTAVYELIEKYGGFIESSFVSGKDYSDAYYGYQTYRYANFTIRVPKESFAAMTDSLSTVGNVTGTSVSADNITAQFTDAQARLETYEAEEQRLIEMMEKAETVEDLISIEARLSEVRYQIESVTSTLRNWQNEVDYSTVAINLQEVRELTQIVEVPKTFGQEITEGFKSTLVSVGRFFRDLAAWIIINLPVLVVLAVVLAIVILIIKKSFGEKSKARRAARIEAKRMKKLAKKAKKAPVSENETEIK